MGRDILGQLPGGDRQGGEMESVPGRVPSPGDGARERAGDKGRSHLCKGGSHLHETPLLGCEAKAHPAGRVGDLSAFSWTEIWQFADEFVSSARPLIKNFGGCLLPGAHCQ